MSPQTTTPNNLSLAMVAGGTTTIPPPLGSATVSTPSSLTPRTKPSSSSTPSSRSKQQKRRDLLQECETKQSLTWFQSRRNKWDASPRTPIRPIRTLELVNTAPAPTLPTTAISAPATTTAPTLSLISSTDNSSGTHDDATTQQHHQASSITFTSILCRDDKVQVDEDKLRVNTNNNNFYRDRLIQFYQQYNPSKVSHVDQTLQQYKGREIEMFMKLNAKYNTTTSLPKYPSPPPPSSSGSIICFLDFAVTDTRSDSSAGAGAGRVLVELFVDQVPLTCRNFMTLCLRPPRYGYRNSLVHRIVSNFCIQMGDYTKGDGTGGKSIYNSFSTPEYSKFVDMWGNFVDEAFMQHNQMGLLSMANNGPNRNSSQFFITLKPLPHLNGKHVVFGRVIQGMDAVVQPMGQLPTDNKQGPLHHDVQIVDCGVVLVNDGTQEEIRDEHDPLCLSLLSTLPKTPLSSDNTPPMPQQQQPLLPFGGSSSDSSSSITATTSANSLSFASLVSKAQSTASPFHTAFTNNSALASTTSLRLSIANNTAIPSSVFGGGSLSSTQNATPQASSSSFASLAANGNDSNSKLWSFSMNPPISSFGMTVPSSTTLARSSNGKEESALSGGTLFGSTTKFPMTTFGFDATGSKASSTTPTPSAAFQGDEASRGKDGVESSSEAVTSSFASLAVAGTSTVLNSASSTPSWSLTSNPSVTFGTVAAQGMSSSAPLAASITQAAPESNNSSPWSFSSNPTSTFGTVAAQIGNPNTPTTGPSSFGGSAFGSGTTLSSPSTFAFPMAASATAATAFSDTSAFAPRWESSRDDLDTRFRSDHGVDEDDDDDTTERDEDESDEDEDDEYDPEQDENSEDYDSDGTPSSRSEVDSEQDDVDLRSDATPELDEPLQEAVSTLPMSHPHQPTCDSGGGSDAAVLTTGIHTSMFTSVHHQNSHDEPSSHALPGTHKSAFHDNGITNVQAVTTQMPVTDQLTQLHASVASSNESSTQHQETQPWSSNDKSTDAATVKSTTDEQERNQESSFNATFAANLESAAQVPETNENLSSNDPTGSESAAQVLETTQNSSLNTTGGANGESVAQVLEKNQFSSPHDADVQETSHSAALTAISAGSVESATQVQVNCQSMPSIATSASSAEPGTKLTDLSSLNETGAAYALASSAVASSSAHSKVMPGAASSEGHAFGRWSDASSASILTFGSLAASRTPEIALGTSSQPTAVPVDAFISASGGSDTAFTAVRNTSSSGYEDDGSTSHNTEREKSDEHSEKLCNSVSASPAHQQAEPSVSNERCISDDFFKVGCLAESKISQQVSMPSKGTGKAETLLAKSADAKIESDVTPVVSAPPIMNPQSSTDPNDTIPNVVSLAVASLGVSESPNSTSQIDRQNTPEILARAADEPAAIAPVIGADYDGFVDPCASKMVPEVTKSPCDLNPTQASNFSMLDSDVVGSLQVVEATGAEEWTQTYESGMVSEVIELPTKLDPAQTPEIVVMYCGEVDEAGSDEPTRTALPAGTGESVDLFESADGNLPEVPPRSAQSKADLDILRSQSLVVHESSSDASESLAPSPKLDTTFEMGASVDSQDTLTMVHEQSCPAMLCWCVKRETNRSGATDAVVESMLPLGDGSTLLPESGSEAGTLEPGHQADDMLSQVWAAASQAVLATASCQTRSELTSGGKVEVPDNSTIRSLRVESTATTQSHKAHMNDLPYSLIGMFTMNRRCDAVVDGHRKNTQLLPSTTAQFQVWGVDGKSSRGARTFSASCCAAPCTKPRGGNLHANLPFDIQSDPLHSRITRYNRLPCVSLVTLSTCVETGTDTNRPADNVAAVDPTMEEIETTTQPGLTCGEEQTSSIVDTATAAAPFYFGSTGPEPNVFHFGAAATPSPPSFGNGSTTAACDGWTVNNTNLERASAPTTFYFGQAAGRPVIQPVLFASDDLDSAQVVYAKYRGDVPPSKD